MNVTAAQPELPQTGLAWFTLALSTCALILLCVWALLNQDKLFNGDGFGFGHSDRQSLIEPNSSATKNAIADSSEQDKLKAAKQIAEQEAAKEAAVQKLAAEKLAAAEAAQAKADALAAENLAAEQALAAEREATAAQELAAEKLAAEQVEAQKLAAEQAQAEKLALEQAAAEKLAAEQVEAAKLAAERAEAEKLAAERVEFERIEAEKLAVEKLAAERAEADRVAAETLAAEREAAVIAQQAAAEEAERQKLAADEAEAERLAARELLEARLLAEKQQAEQLSALPRRTIPAAGELDVLTGPAPQNESAFAKSRREELAQLPGLSAQLQFKSNDIEPTDSSRQPLDRIFELLFLYAETTVVVQVASNEYEIDDNNQLISRERALTLVNYLIDRGLDEDRFRIRSLGKQQLPFDSHRVTVVATVIE